MRKIWVAAVWVAAVMMAGIVQAGRIDLPNAGWSVNWSDALASSIEVQDAGSTASQAHIALKLIFDDASFNTGGFFDPLLVAFNQLAPTVAPRLVVDTTVVNNASTNFDALRIFLLGGVNTVFDVPGMNIGQPGGLNPSPFTVAVSSDHRNMYFSDGNLPSGQSFTLSQSVGVMVASGPGRNDDPNMFSLKMMPTPSNVPEPTSLGVVALGMMLVLVRRRTDGEA